MFKVLSESEITLHNYVNYVKKQEFLTRIYAYDVVQVIKVLTIFLYVFAFITVYYFGITLNLMVMAIF